MKRIAEEFATAYFNKDTDSIKVFSNPFEWDIEVDFYHYLISQQNC